jgi:hypothetical protein
VDERKRHEHHRVHLRADARDEGGARAPGGTAGQEEDRGHGEPGRKEVEALVEPEGLELGDDGVGEERGVGPPSPPGPCGPQDDGPDGDVHRRELETERQLELAQGGGDERRGREGEQGVGRVLERDLGVRSPPREPRPGSLQIHGKVAHRVRLERRQERDEAQDEERDLRKNPRARRRSVRHRAPMLARGVPPGKDRVQLSPSA